MWSRVVLKTAANVKWKSLINENYSLWFVFSNYLQIREIGQEIFPNRKVKNLKKVFYFIMFFILKFRKLVSTSKVSFCPVSAD